MSVAFVFWLLMLLWLIFGFIFLWPVGAVSWYPVGGNLLLFVLLCLLGWKVFGFPIHG